MERPRFLTAKNVWQVLAAGGLWFSTACINPVNTEPKPISQPPVPTATPARFWEGARLSPVSKGQFTTNKGRTYWSNFTTTPFDTKAAERMLQTFEHFAQQRRSFAIQIFDPQDLQRNEVVSTLISPEPPTDLVLNLIPNEAPLPEWAIPKSLWGVSERFLGTGHLETFVKITGQDDNLRLGRIFCQSRLNIKVSSPRLLIIADDHLLREAVCNGHNLAIAARRKNTPYERYKLITGEALIDIPLTLAYQLPVLSEPDYLAIPQQTRAIGPRFGKPPSVAQRYFFWGVKNSP